MNGIPSLTLTYDEVVAFLDILGLVIQKDSIVTQDMLEMGSAHKEIAEAIQNGKLSLKKRGLVVQSEERLLSTEILLGLVGSTFIPDANLRLIHIVEGLQYQVHQFSLTPEILVEVTTSLPDYDSFTFSRIQDSKTLEQRIRDMWQTLPTSSSTPQTSILNPRIIRRLPTDTGMKFLSLCQMKKFDLAAQVLKQAGLDDTEFNELIESISFDSIWIATLTTNLRSIIPDKPITTAIVECDKVCWLLQDIPGNTDVKVKVTHHEECLDTLLNMAQSFLNNQPILNEFDCEKDI